MCVFGGGGGGGGGGNCSSNEAQFTKPPGFALSNPTEVKCQDSFSLKALSEPVLIIT